MEPRRPPLKLPNQGCLTEVHMQRPVTREKYLTTTLILKAMIDHGLIAPSPNALYMLQGGIQWYYHLHPDGVITSANPGNKNCFRSPNAVAQDLLLRSHKRIPGSKKFSVAWASLYSTQHHVSLKSLRDTYTAKITQAGGKLSYGQALICNREKGDGNKLLSVASLEQIEAAYAQTIHQTTSDNGSSVPTPFYTRSWAAADWQTPSPFNPLAIPLASEGKVITFDGGKRPPKRIPPPTIPSKQARRQSPTSTASGKARRKRAPKFKDIPIDRNKGIQCPSLKCQRWYATKLALDDHCRSVHCFGIQSRHPMPHMEAVPNGATVYKLVPIDNSKVTLAAIERSRQRAGVPVSEWEREDAATASVAPPRRVQRHAASTAVAVRQVNPIQPHPIYLRVQDQIFAELWALFSSGACLTTTFQFTPEVAQEQVLVPTYSSDAQIVRFATPTLYEISGSERRANDMRRSKERLKAQLLSGDLKLEPSLEADSSASPLTQLGVKGDVSCLLSSPTRATASMEQDMDEEEDADQLELADGNFRRSRRARAGGLTLARLAKASVMEIDPFTLVHCDQPSDVPFQVKISSNVMLVMDMHSHLASTEIIGYLAGTFDARTRTLVITEVIPCPALESDQTQRDQSVEMDPNAQVNAMELIKRKGLAFAGWYHSHPTFPPEPSVRDIENQTASQMMFMEQPYVGIINAPYYHSTTSSAKAVADVKCFWINTDKVVTFAATDFGTPIRVPFTVEDAPAVTADILHKLMNLCRYYEVYQQRVALQQRWEGSRLTKVEKLRCSLLARLPKQMSMDVKSLALDRIVDLLNMSEALNHPQQANMSS
eukprot:m.243019 g.243019  ORF g.243019 m.243019 type:complete len:828 (-) comp17457_c1_seq8:185-2668(-)